MTRTQGSAAPPDSAPHRLTQEERLTYWRKNLSLTVGLLIVWFVVAYLLGIIFAPAMNAAKLVQAPLGYWIAQQGAIYVFILLIVIYAARMNALDKQSGVEG
ncbi:DUF4212 domain-containing protein [Deinococcus sp.]|uniref:DUF4212 domain-containing protein n=1 Tax=Deinococcus sp. TaxID=47478 RepID=UPI003B5C1DA9